MITCNKHKGFIIVIDEQINEYITCPLCNALEKIENLKETIRDLKVDCEYYQDTLEKN